MRYVDVNNASPTPPYTSWATAARIIQDAVDAAASGEEIVVTNGIYASGGRAVYGTLTNRVAVDKPLTLRSVNGPEFTIIKGYQVPGNLNGTGDGAIRCVYLTNGASLVGFTLTNGATQVVNDYRVANGGGVWCETTNAFVTDCVIVGNSAYGYSGGAYRGTLNNCTLASNKGNTGGGASGSTLRNCMLSGNSAYEGGGTYGGRLNNCALIGNSAAARGGGTYGGTLSNCTLTRNAADRGGGAFGGDLKNCTLTDNLAGAGAILSGLTNCIVYFNQPVNFYFNNYPQSLDRCFFEYCCTTPIPGGCW